MFKCSMAVVFIVICFPSSLLEWSNMRCVHLQHVMLHFAFIQVLYSDSFRKQVQGKAAFVLDTPEMRRVKQTQRIISGVNFIFILHTAICGLLEHLE